MSLLDIFRRKGKEAPEEEALQSHELSAVERNRENSVASAREIVSAIDALLFSMRTSRKYPNLTEENIASLADRFNNLQKVLGGTHCDSDVSELDGNILSLVSSLESQLAESPMEEWDRTIARLNDAVRARLKSEYDIRMAALDTSELFLEHTNAAWQSQIKELEAALAQAGASEQRRLNITINVTRNNVLMNEQRLDEIKSLRLQLENDRVSPSAGVLRDIDNLLSGIRTATPEIVKIVQHNEEEIRRKTVETNVVVDTMIEANQKFQDALGAAEIQAVAQDERFQQVAQTVAESVPEAQPQQESEAVAE